MPPRPASMGPPPPRGAPQKAHAPPDDELGMGTGPSELEDPMGDEWEDPDLAQKGGKRRRGGAHDKQTMWTGDEDLLLTNVVNGGAYMEKGKLQWKKLTIEHFPTRNDAAVRNHYLRTKNAKAEREREDGDKKRNKCRKCGQIKFGHRCTGLQWIIDAAAAAVTAAAAPALAAGSGSGGSAAGSSAGGKLDEAAKIGKMAAEAAKRLSLRAAGLKVIASARIVKRFNNFIKLSTILDLIGQGDPIDDDLDLVLRGWADQFFVHGLAPSDNYPPNGRPRALTRAVTEALDASFEAYVKSLFDDF